MAGAASASADRRVARSSSDSARGLVALHVAEHVDAEIQRDEPERQVPRRASAASGEPASSSLELALDHRDPRLDAGRDLGPSSASATPPPTISPSTVTYPRSRSSA